MNATIGNNRSGGMARPPLPVAVTAESHPGRVRENNEDSFGFEPAGSPRAAGRGVLCLVADGVGGQAAGEVASATAVSVVLDRYYRSQNADVSSALRSAVEAANADVWRQAQTRTERTGMASTCTVAVVHQDTLTVAHVGDSRAYLVRDGKIQQLTSDHSQVAQLVAAGVLTPEEARQHPNRNVILRALGREATVDVDIITRPVQDGDCVVLCSDGLSGVVEDADIAALATSGPLDQAVGRLIAAANEGGAPDNVTVGLIQIGRRPATRAGVPPASRGRGVLTLTVIGLGVLALALAVLALFLSGRSSPAPTNTSNTAPTMTSAPTPEPPAAIVTAPAPQSTPAALPPTSPPATQPGAVAATGPAETPSGPVPTPIVRPTVESTPLPPIAAAPAKPAIASPEPVVVQDQGGSPQPASTDLDRALADFQVSEDTREICRLARPDRPVMAHLQARATLRAAPNPEARDVGVVEQDAVVTILQCVVGAPALDSRIWSLIAANPASGTPSSYVLGSLLVLGTPEQRPADFGPGPVLGNETPRPAESPIRPQGPAFDNRIPPGQPAPGQTVPSDQGPLNRN